MAYDEELAARVRERLGDREGLTERRMFGGTAFMVGGHMCCGVVGEDLVMRLGREGADAALDEPHTRPMDFTGKPMSGFVYVAPSGVADAEALERWLGRGLEFVGSLPPKA